MAVSEGHQKSFLGVRRVTSAAAHRHEEVVPTRQGAHPVAAAAAAGRRGGSDRVDGRACPRWCRRGRYRRRSRPGPRTWPGGPSAVVGSVARRRGEGTAPARSTLGRQHRRWALLRSLRAPRRRRRRACREPTGSHQPTGPSGRRPMARSSRAAERSASVALTVAPVVVEPDRGTPARAAAAPSVSWT